MANKRVKDLPNANTLADADELIIDSSSAGTRRISYSELKSEVAADYVAAPSTYKVATLASDNKLDPSQVPDTLSQGLNFVGNANSAGDLTSTTQGDFYVIQTAFGVYSVGDQAVYDGSSYVRVTDGTKQISEGGTGATTLSDAQINLEIGNIGTGANDIPLCGMLNSGAWVDWDAFYEEGTWTPTVSFGGASNGTYNIQEGGFQKTGQLVHVWCQVNNTTKHASNTGSVTVDGLPYTAAGSNVPYVGSAALHNAASLSGQTVTLIAGGTNSAMIFDSGVNGTSAVTDVNYNSSTIIRISITYKIA